MGKGFSIISLGSGISETKSVATKVLPGFRSRKISFMAVALSIVKFSAALQTITSAISLARGTRSISPLIG